MECNGCEKPFEKDLLDNDQLCSECAKRTKLTKKEVKGYNKIFKKDRCLVDFDGWDLRGSPSTRVLLGKISTLGYVTDEFIDLREEQYSFYRFKLTEKGLAALSE